ncbi:hypothetical protein ACFL23_00225 [Patescibacteria group bacterium]
MENVVNKIKNGFNTNFNLFFNDVLEAVIISAVIFLFLAIIIINLNYPIWPKICVGFFISAIICFIAFLKFIENEKKNCSVKIAFFSIMCSILSVIAGITFLISSIMCVAKIKLLSDISLSSLLLISVIDGGIVIFSLVALNEIDIIIDQFTIWRNIVVTVVSFLFTGILFYVGYYYFYY